MIEIPTTVNVPRIYMDIGCPSFYSWKNVAYRDILKYNHALLKYKKIISWKSSANTLPLMVIIYHDFP